MTATVTIRIQEADFDIAREIAALTQGRTDIGAVVTFQRHLPRQRGRRAASRR